MYLVVSKIQLHFTVTRCQHLLGNLLDNWQYSMRHLWDAISKSFTLEIMVRAFKHSYWIFWQRHLSPAFHAADPGSRLARGHPFSTEYPLYGNWTQLPPSSGHSASKVLKHRIKGKGNRGKSHIRPCCIGRFEYVGSLNKEWGECAS